MTTGATERQSKIVMRSAVWTPVKRDTWTRLAQPIRRPFVDRSPPQRMMAKRPASRWNARHQSIGNRQRHGNGTQERVPAAVKFEAAADLARFAAGTSRRRRTRDDCVTAFAAEVRLRARQLARTARGRALADGLGGISKRRRSHRGALLPAGRIAGRDLTRPCARRRRPFRCRAARHTRSVASRRPAPTRGRVERQPALHRASTRR